MRKKSVIKILLVCLVIVMVGAVIPCANFACDDDDSTSLAVSHDFSFLEVTLAPILHVTCVDFELVMSQPSSTNLYLELHEKSPPSCSH